MNKPVPKERGLKGDKEGDEQLTKKELLNWIGEKLDIYVAENKLFNGYFNAKCRNQIREIVEDYPEKRAEVEALREDVDALQEELGEQQKPRVTKEEIRDVIMGMEQAIKKPPVDYLISNDLKIAIDFLANWLKSKGLKVED